MTRLDGPDVSHYQYFQNGVGDPDWAACRAAGCWWGATKLTQSTGYLDATAARSRQGMRDAGFTHVGLYHWLSATTDLIAQAEWYLKNLGELRDGEFAMLDAEEAGINVDMAAAWFDHVEARTGRVGVDYTGAFVAGGSLWQSIDLHASPHGQRPRILAAYTTEAKALKLPGVAEHPWQAWQFSSNGPVPGITGRCDMNRVDDRAVFDAAAGLTHHDTEVQPPPPSHQEPDMPAIVTNEDAYDDAEGHHDALSTKWEYLGGERIHITLEYWNGLGAPVGNPRPYAEIQAVPDQPQPVELTSELIEAPPMHFTGTIDLRSAG